MEERSGSVGARSGSRHLLIGISVMLVALLIGLAAMIHRNEVAAHRALADRFESRAALTASFAEKYVDDVAERERTQAERLLAGPDVDEKSFDSVVRSFGFPAAVLLDSTGHLLQVWPAKPALIGQDMTKKYEHLRTAVGGKVGVSQTVPSAASGEPVTAVAVPFESASGRRVFSGAFTPATTPLDAYLDSIVAVQGGSARLIDRSGVVLAGRSHAGGDEQLAKLRPGVRDVRGADGRITTAVADVPALPWRVVLTSPSKALYAPVTRGRWAPWALWFALAGAGCLALGLFVRLGRARAEAAMSARTDLLTGLPNRRSMQETFAKAAAISARHDVPLAALMIDIDNFKAINDEHGHDGGDLVIRSTADALVEAIREGDIAARWGGEEFLVLLQHTDYDGVRVVAERVRQTIALATPPGRLSSHHATVSIGLAMLHNGDSSTLLRDADIALYAAKANGRNRVETWMPLLDVPEMSNFEGIIRRS